MRKIVELRPSRNLLNNKFETYQLNNVVTPKESYPLSKSAFHKERSLEQVSFLEAHIFAYHNHLFTNYFDNSCWFIDNEKYVWRFQDKELKSVYKLQGELNDAVYNPSIAFTSHNIIAILNGNKSLEILVFQGNNMENFVFNDIKPGVILDIQYIEDNSSLIVAINGIVEVNTKKQSEIILYTYACKKNDSNHVCIGNLIRKQIFKIDGSVEYLYIEENGNFIQIASQKEVSFEFDSLNPVENKNEDNEVTIPKYSWSQDENTLTLWIKIPENLSDMKEHINITLDKILVLIGDHIILEGKMAKLVQPDLSTWQRKKDLLEIDLTKQISGLMWDQFILNDKSGEYMPNAALAAEIHAGLSHLCTDQQEKDDGGSSIGFNSAQLEDCDFEGRENLMQRININTHQPTHMAIVKAGSDILFSQKIKNKLAVCLRNDHDGCIWFFGNGDEEVWEMKHTYTFPGYGYIQAGKENKKFALFSIDGSYIAILEYLSHAFIYEKSEKNATVGKQRIIEIDQVTPILGASIINNNLLVLTTNVLYLLRVIVL